MASMAVTVLMKYLEVGVISVGTIKATVVQASNMILPIFTLNLSLSSFFFAFKYWQYRAKAKNIHDPRVV